LGRSISRCKKMINKAQYNASGFPQGLLTGQDNFEQSLGQLREQVSHLESELGGLKEDQQNLSHRLNAQDNTTTQVGQQDESTIDRIKHICRRFHLVAQDLERQSRRIRINEKNYDERFTITHENHVHHILWALLHLFFDDVRHEEHISSFGGHNSRLDFLIKDRNIGIEVKLARQNLRDAQVRDELLADIAQYQNHPTLETLICFVYDPNHQLHNPAALETDLTMEVQMNNRRLAVHTLVSPHCT